MSMGFSLSFNYDEQGSSFPESKEKLNKSVEPPSFFEFAPFIRSFGSSQEEEKESTETKRKPRRSSNSARRISISSSTESMNSEITEMRSSQYECEPEISKKSCCVCAVL